MRGNFAEVMETRLVERSEFVDKIWRTLLIHGEVKVVLKNGRTVVAKVSEDSMETTSGD